MKRLYNSRGNHVANEVNGQLHEPTGRNIGHFLTRESIFIDLHGRYLGEIVMNDRLMRNRNSRHSSVSFGNRGYYGTVGNYGTPGNHGSLRQPAGYEDIPEELLGRAP